MPYILATAAAVLCAFIEWIRWKASYGKVPNLNKKITVLIAFALCITVVLILRLFHWPVIFFALFFFGIRGTLYDPLLNVFMGRYIDHESETTNSWADNREQQHKISFWMQRLLYLAVAVVFAILYQISK